MTMRCARTCKPLSSIAFKHALACMQRIKTIAHSHEHARKLAQAGRAENNFWSANNGKNSIFFG